MGSGAAELGVGVDGTELGAGGGRAAAGVGALVGAGTTAGAGTVLVGWGAGGSGTAGGGCITSCSMVGAGGFSRHPGKIETHVPTSRRSLGQVIPLAL